MKLTRKNGLIISTLIGYIGAVFFCCLYNFSGSSSVNLGNYLFGIRLDRLVHFILFFPYPFICWAFITCCIKIPLVKRHTYLATFTSGFLLAAIAESSQELLTSYRDSDPFDFIANITAITSGTLICLFLEKVLFKKSIKNNVKNK